MTDTLNNLTDIYFAARDQYELAKKRSDLMHEEWRATERNLVDYMIENGIKKVGRADGTTPMLVNAVSISVTQENYDAISQWLKDTLGDDKDFLVTIPHKPTILDYVKKQIAEGSDPSDFPVFLHCDTRPTLRVDGWKTRQ